MNAWKKILIGAVALAVSYGRGYLDGKNYGRAIAKPEPAFILMVSANKDQIPDLEYRGSGLYENIFFGIGDSAFIHESKVKELAKKYNCSVDEVLKTHKRELKSLYPVLEDFKRERPRVSTNLESALH